MNNTEDVKDFFAEEYADEKLGFNLPAATYHLEVTECATDEWDDGRPRLDVSTKVVCGDYADAFGPRVTLSVGESSGTSAKGRDFTISAADAAKRIRVLVKAIHGEKAIALSPGEYRAETLEEIGKALTGDTFYGNVAQDKKGYDRIGKIYSISEPPKGFVCECQTKGITL